MSRKPGSFDNKVTPDDADRFPYVQTPFTSGTPEVQTTWSQIKTALQSAFATVFQPVNANLSAIASVSTTGFYVRTGAGTVATRSITAGSGVTVANVTGGVGDVVIAVSNVQTSNANLTGITSVSTTGIYVRTGAGTAVARSLVAGTGVTITNTDGVAGNITIAVSGVASSDLPPNVSALASVSTTGIYVRTGANTAVARTLVAGTGVTITNADGVAGNITIAISGVGADLPPNVSALASVSTTGIYVRTGANTAVARSITAGTGVTITNGSGVAGDITVAVSNVQVSNANLTGITSVSTTGIYVRTGAGTAVARSLTAGTGVTITNADGVAGNITVAVSVIGVTNGGTGLTAATSGHYIKASGTNRYESVSAGVIAADIGLAVVTLAANEYMAKNNANSGGEARLDKRGLPYAVYVSSATTVTLTMFRWPDIQYTTSYVELQTFEAASMMVLWQVDGSNANGFSALVTISGTAVTVSTVVTYTRGRVGRFIVASASNATGFLATFYGVRTAN